MATYAIGDLQGCFQTLMRLLEQVRFDPAADRLWLVGDLVNRGPRSLETLRWLVEHAGRVTAVLGNHDLYLLARDAGALGPRKGETIGPVLEAPDRRRLLAWLKARPLVHREGDFVMVHAGLHPRWSVEEAEAKALAIHRALHGDHARALLGDVRKTNRELGPRERRLQYDLSVFTRMRMLRRNGEPEYTFNGRPEEAPAYLTPWFEVPHHRPASVRVLFGHWAALGFRISSGMVALDSGCVWGEKLTAYRLEDGEVFQQAHAE